ATAVASASAADCAGVVPWAQGTLGRLSQVGTIVAPISALANQPNATVDPTSTRQIATQLQTLADDQRNSNPPPAAADLNTVVVTAFQNFADAINKLADAAQANNTTAMLAAAQEFQNASKVFAQGGDAAKLEADLVVACPELKSLTGG